MDIGTGIAIAGAWIFAGMVGISNTTTTFGLYVVIGCAAIVTAVLM